MVNFCIMMLLSFGRKVRCPLSAQNHSFLRVLAGFQNS